MCLIAIAWRHHPRFPLVVAANRDEFHQRPTAPASFWPDFPRILAGRDVLGRGTWLGISSGGRFAALTNLRLGREMRRDAPSRGSLVSAFLCGESTPAAYLSDVARRAGDYNGFSLVAGDGEEVGYYCAPDAASSTLAPGIHGISNTSLDTPWPRVERLKAGLSEVLSRSRWQTDDLVELLGDRRQAPDDTLPDTGVVPEREPTCSPVFISGEQYGTRSSTVLCVDAGGRVEFTEQSFGPSGRQGARTHFSFLIDSLTRVRAAR